MRYENLAPLDPDVAAQVFVTLRPLIVGSAGPTKAMVEAGVDAAHQYRLDHAVRVDAAGKLGRGGDTFGLVRAILNAALAAGY